MDDWENMEGDYDNCYYEWQLAKEEIDKVLLHMWSSLTKTFITVKGTNYFNFLSSKPEQKFNDKIAKNQEHGENHAQKVAEK